MQIAGIQEVLEFTRVTKVPRSADYMMGVLNLRGQIVPVIDLRRYLELDVTEPTVDSCIIIVEVVLDGEKSWVGLLADRVHEVVELDADQVEAPPKIGNKIGRQFIHGIVEHDEKFIILLSLQRLFSAGELRYLMDTGSADDVEGLS